MEVSNLLIDSIGAKLSILNKIAEMQWYYSKILFIRFMILIYFFQK
jgi:hypothetical protein